MNLNEEEEEINPKDIHEENSNPINKKEETSNKKNSTTKITTRKWRVKLYRLNDIGQWDDFGIGFVFCENQIFEEGKTINKLIMLNELTEEEMFNIEINNNTVEFHNQRGTIMTWKTGDDDGDDNIAISFQEKDGVIEIMKNILICQGKNPNDESLFMDISEENSYKVTIQNLPNLMRELSFDMDEQKLMNFINNLKSNDCKFIVQMGQLLKEEEEKIENLKTIATASSSLVNMNNTNNEINNYVNKNTNNQNKENNNNKNNEINNEYNQQQKQIYKDLPMENIHYIFNIFKNLILIGDKDLIEILIDDKYYLITFGALEYDFQTMKSVPHRKYFKDIVKFKNPLNIQDEEILKKINQNLRLCYLRDTALSRLIEDNAIKTINLLLQLNYNDIIQFFLNDTKYFELLFKEMQSEDLNKKKESCLFLSELMECSKNVLQSRITFCESLFEQGILKVLEQIIEENKKDENKEIDKNYQIKEFIRIQAVEIFINILAFIPNAILDYIKKENDHKLLKQLTNIMLYSNNFGIKYEICQIYKNLIETQLKEKTLDRMELFIEPFKILLKFLQTPINSKDSQPISHEKKLEISSTKQIIIEILMTWFSLMSFNKQFWIDENSLNTIISDLLLEQDKVINLYTIKLLKCIIDITDPFVSNKLISKQLCNNLSQLFNNNIKKNNIIISCLMDFFESLSKNKQIIFNSIMIYMNDFFYKNKKYFKIILLRYENKELPKKELINFLKNDYKDNESLFLYDFEYKDMGEIYGDEEKEIDYLSKKREREEYIDEIFDNCPFVDNHKKNISNDYYNRIMFEDKGDNYDNDENDDIKKTGFLNDIRVNENEEENINNNSGGEENNYHL